VAAQERFLRPRTVGRAGGEKDRSNSEAPAPSYVEAVAEGEFEAEPAA
jgi:hypothetical protein